VQRPGLRGCCKRASASGQTELIEHDDGIEEVLGPKSVDHPRNSLPQVTKFLTAVLAVRDDDPGVMLADPPPRAAQTQKVLVIECQDCTRVGCRACKLLFIDPSDRAKFVAGNDVVAVSTQKTSEFGCDILIEVQSRFHRSRKVTLPSSPTVNASSAAIASGVEASISRSISRRWSW
jgi:hypothetical protein